MFWKHPIKVYMCVCVTQCDFVWLPLFLHVSMIKLCMSMTNKYFYYHPSRNKHFVFVSVRRLANTGYAV